MGETATGAALPERLGRHDGPLIPGWGSVSRCHFRNEKQPHLLEPENARAEGQTRPSPSPSPSPHGSTTHTEDDALHRILGLTEQPPADLRGEAGASAEAAGRLPHGHTRLLRSSLHRTRVTRPAPEGWQMRLSALWGRATCRSTWTFIFSTAHTMCAIGRGPAAAQGRKCLGEGHSAGQKLASPWGGQPAPRHWQQLLSGWQRGLGSL